MSVTIFLRLILAFKLFKARTALQPYTAAIVRKYLRTRFLSRSIRRILPSGLVAACEDLL